MPITSAQVNGPLYSPGLVALVDAKIIFDLKSWDADPDDDVFVTGPYIADIDEQGNFSVNLFINSNGVNQSVYDVYVSYIDENTQQLNYDPRLKKYLGTVSLSGEGPFHISDLNFTSEHTPGSFDLYAAMQGLLADATVQAQLASTSQTQTSADILVSAQHVIDAEAAATAAETSEQNASSFATTASNAATTANQAATTATDAASDATTKATEANASAIQAATSETNASNSANQAAISAAIANTSQVQKHLLSSDWQPRPSTISPPSGEVSRFENVLSVINGRHPNLTHGHVLGDHIHEGSVDTTGADPEHTYDDYLTAIRTNFPNIPWDHWGFIPGNHDRDGTGIGSFENAWSLKTYRSWFGPEYFYTVNGNILMMYLGDMGGTTGGAISTAAIDWFKEVANENKDKNIFLCLHHPISGTYQGRTEASDPTAVQADSDRLSNVLTEISNDADNVIAVFYGHVGSEFQFNQETHFGTEHIQIGMHIPSNVTNGRNDQYYIFEIENGDTNLEIERWDATADVYVDSKTLALKYPIILGTLKKVLPNTHQFTVNLPIDDYRVFGTDWDIDITNPIWGAKLRFEDRGNDNVPNNLEVGYGIDFPGSSGEATFDLGATRSTSVDDLGITWRLENGSDTIPDVSIHMYGANNGIRERLIKILPSSQSYPGLQVLSGRVLVHSVGDIEADFDTTEFTGSQLNPNGKVYFGNNTASLHLQRNASNGAIANFYRSTTAVGSISVTDTGTAYNTTSDRRLKENLRSFDAMEMIENLNAYLYERIGFNQSEYGLIAQDVYEVLPNAVSVGGEDPKKDPWLLDHSKLVPVLLKAIKELNEKIKKLEEKVKE